MAETAVLVIDMMNTYRHPDADALVPNVGKLIEPLTDLVRRARESDDVDLVYVNDNYREITKVRHSAFYSTPLAYLLNTARSTPTYATSR